MEEQRHPPTPLHLPEHSAKTQALPVSRSPTWASLCHLSDYLFILLQRERNFAAEENDPLPLYSWVLSVNRNSKTVFHPCTAHWMVLVIGRVSGGTHSKRKCQAQRHRLLPKGKTCSHEGSAKSRVNSVHRHQSNAKNRGQEDNACQLPPPSPSSQSLKMPLSTAWQRKNRSH